MKFSDAVEDFILDRRVKGCSPKTLQSYRENFKAFTGYLGKDIDVNAIDRATLNQYVIYLQDKGTLSSVSVQTRVRALRTFLRFCYEEDYISIDLAEKFKLPRAKRARIDVLTDSEIDQIFSCFDTHDAVQLRNNCICALMLDSGLRLNEVVTLDMERLHLAEGYCIVEGKGNKERMVPLGLHTRQTLTRYIRKRPSDLRTGPVFLLNSNKPISQNTVKQLFRKLKKKTGITRLHPHLLRHTFATRYLENGGDMYSLQQILGHTTLEMVKKYVHLAQNKTVSRFANFCPLDNLDKK